MGRALDDHLDHLRARNLRPSYLQARSALLRRLERHLDHDPLEADVDALRTYLDRGLRAGSRATEIAHLRSFYQWALIEGHIDRDPTVRLERPKQPAGQPRPIPTASLTVALASAIAPVRAMLYLAAYAGLRACEIAPLRGEHVLLDADPAILVVLEGKGGATGTIPVSATLAAVLAELPRRGLLFPRIDGKEGPMSRWRVCQMCNQHLHRQGIPDTLHSLRHWYGTELYRATRDLRLTQKLMRHASSATTDRYTFIADEAGVAAVSQLPLLHPQTFADGEIGPGVGKGRVAPTAPAPGPLTIRHPAGLV